MTPGRASPLLMLLLAAICLSACQSPRPRFEDESAHRLNRSPASHAGRAVILHGVAEEPVSGPQDDGTPLGAYTLRDSSGSTVRVLTRSLPRPGKTYRVTGFVGQVPENALRPLVLEARRSRPGRDLLVIFGLLVLVVGSVPPAVARLTSGRVSAAGPPPGSAVPALDGPPVRPGVKYILDLVVVAGPDNGRHHTFTSDRILVGRPGRRRNDLVLDDQTVSRNQAVILRDEKIGGYKIRNEGRTNPLKVNGRPCDAVALRDGDLLTVGLTTLQVCYREPGPGRPLLPVLLLGLLLLPAGAAARAGDTGVVQLDALDVLQLPRVTCRFRVFDTGGAERTGLEQGDFRVLVDGRELKEADLRFDAVPGHGMPRLVLVLQATREERGRGLFLLKSAVTGFLERWPASGPVSLVSHGASARLEQGFTTDRRRILQGLESISLGDAEDRGYYAALKLAADQFGPGEPGPGAIIYFCSPGPFSREDMRPEAPKGLRDHPGLPVYPVLHPQRDGRRTREYLRLLALKLTEGFTGHYTLQYGSPGGEDNRVHSLRIDRITPASQSGGASCRYLAVSGSGLETGELLAAVTRRSLMDRLAGLLLGLLAGVLAFRWIVGSAVPYRWLRIHFLLAGAAAGFLLSLLADRVI